MEILSDIVEERIVAERLAQNPERRIFNIATGNLTKTEAEEYIQKLKSIYRGIINKNSSQK